jgi:hydrogenase maturation protease
VHFLFLPFREADGAPGVTGLLIIGIGNPDCGDDAIGPLVARLLLGRVPPGVTLLERAGDMLGLIEDWTGCQGVVLIDAAAAITTPGSFHRIDLLREPLPVGLSLASTHGFGVADAIELARALGQLPERLIVYAVEGCRFEPGAPQSPEVVAAAESVAARVVLELLRLTSFMTPPARGPMSFPPCPPRRTKEAPNERQAYSFLATSRTRWE